MSVSPTGRKRYRVHKRCFSEPVLVLQIEVDGYEPFWDYGYFRRRQEYVRYWRDATVEDLSESEVAA